jgi:uncharacterized protein YcnI
MTNPVRTAATAAALLTLAVGVAGASPAGAQVELEPTEVPAGSRTTLEFTIVTGCGPSPTMEVAVTLPEGTFDVVAVPPPGFTTLTLDDGGVVVFQGGPLDAETPATFGIQMVTPNTPGVTQLYPVEQTCVDGEISWTDPNAEGEGAAPRLRFTANPTPVTSTTEPGTATTAPAGGSTTLPPLTDPVSTETVQEGDGGSGGTLRNALLVIVVLGGGYWLIRRRNAARE